MDIQPAEISAILKREIQNFGADAQVSEVVEVLSVGDGIAGLEHEAHGIGAVRARLDRREHGLDDLLVVRLQRLAVVRGPRRRRPRPGGWSPPPLPRCAATSPRAPRPGS